MTSDEYKQFNRTISGSRLGHDQLDELLSVALSAKYTPGKLAQLNRASAIFSASFEVADVRDSGTGSLIVTYTYDLPVRMRMVTTVFDEATDTVDLAAGEMLGFMPLFCPFDARAGTTVRAIRRKREAFTDEKYDPPGISRHDRVRVIIRSLPDEH